ncbi:hypothetical protein FZC66_08715 [Priestia megaterium]|nr:hypothetical protein FZC66_08715 [Priestia megaterium]
MLSSHNANYQPCWGKTSNWRLKALDHLLEKESLKAEVRNEYRRGKIELTTENQIEDIVESAIYSFEQELYKKTYQKLSSSSISRMDALMESWVDMENEDKNKIIFRKITLGPGRVSKDTLNEKEWINQMTAEDYRALTPLNLQSY